MPLPRYRSLTQNDSQRAVLTMALSALVFTILAATYHEDPNPITPSNDAEQFPWPAFISSSLLFFAGFLWLVLDSWYHGREWWKLMWRSSWYLSGTGLAHLFGLTWLVPVAMGIWGWTGAMGWVVFRGDFVEGREGFGIRGLGAVPLGDDAERKVAGDEEVPWNADEAA
jgi:hypothetical protein